MSLVERAQVAALLAANDGYDPLPWRRVIQITCNAIEGALERCRTTCKTDEEVVNRLSHIGLIALYDVRTGMVERSLLIERVRGLSEECRTVHSLKIEHGLNEIEISTVLGIAIDEVLLIQLKTSMELLGLQNDRARFN